MQRPLADDVARPARAYLAALVPTDEVSDAWHELADDVAYWGDRDLLSVLRLAHQVVLQHERVAPEAAALVLVETGVDRPEDVATVLDADLDQARRWTREALATRDGGEDRPPEPDTEPEPPAPESTAPDPASAGPEASEPPAEPDATEPATTVSAPAPPRETVRLVFDDADDGPLPDLDGRGLGRRLPVRTLVLAAIALWALVAVFWMLAR